MFLLAACCRRCETSKSARCRACNYRFPFNFNGVRRTSAHPCHSSATPGLAHCYGYIIISADWGGWRVGSCECAGVKEDASLTSTHTHTPSILCAACDKGRAPVTRAFHSCMHVAQPPPTHTIAHARTHTHLRHRESHVIIINFIITRRVRRCSVRYARSRIICYYTCDTNYNYVCSAATGTHNTIALIYDNYMYYMCVCDIM